MALSTGLPQRLDSDFDALIAADQPVPPRKRSLAGGRRDVVADSLDLGVRQEGATREPVLERRHRAHPFRDAFDDERLHCVLTSRRSRGAIISRQVRLV
jgi:hypothetical protein